jgi:hypothetical protein
MNTHSLCCTLVATLLFATAACKGDDLTEPDSGPQDGAAHDGGVAMASDAFTLATLQPGAGGVCAFAQQTTSMEVGVQTGAKPTTVVNGASQAGALVRVACTVHPDHNGYDIDLDVEIAGQGAMHVFSSAPGAVTSSGATGIGATFSQNVGGASQTYSANNCTLMYTYQTKPVPNPMPVAPGRIWAHVSCPDAEAASGVLVDGATVPFQCDAEADFLFENCAQ